MLRSARIIGYGLLPLAGWIAVSSAVAADLSKGDIFTSLRYDDLSPSGSGRGIQVSWLKPMSAIWRLELGAAYNDVADSHWAYGIVGNYLSLREGTDNIFLIIEHGRGDSDAGDFDHTLGKAGLSHALIARQLYLDAEIQVIRIGDVEDELGKLGFSYAPSAPWLFQVHHYRSLSSDGDMRAWSGRVNYTRNNITWFGGLASSTETVDPVSAALGTPRDQDSDEFFLGATFPVKQHALTIVFTDLDQEDAGRQSLTAVWKWALD